MKSLVVLLIVVPIFITNYIVSAQEYSPSGLQSQQQQLQQQQLIPPQTHEYQHQYQHQPHQQQPHKQLQQQQQQKNRQYYYSHTHVEWRRESTQGELSEFYLHETAASSYHQDQHHVEDHMTYIHQYYHHHQQEPQLTQEQEQQQQFLNNLQYQQQSQQQQQQHQHQQQNHQQPQPQLNYHYQQQQPQPQQQQQQSLVNNLHYEQEQQFIYARDIGDEHDFEAAHQYYYNSRPIINAQQGPSCESIDDPTILILPGHFDQPTCKAASTLGRADDPATAAAQATDSFSAHGPSRNSNVESYPLAPQHYHYESSLIAAIRHYWREVSGLCLASAIFLNWLFVVVKQKLIAATHPRPDSLSETSLIPQQSLSRDTYSAHDSAFEENASPMSLDDVESSSTGGKSTKSLQQPRDNSPVLRQRSSTLKAEPTCCLSSGHASLSQSASLSTTISNNSEYISRYSSDFDSIQRLGRGGFGIVFEAKNKIDDCHYAVKRICLPLEKEARERVMREVRALAKLDHAGIVRYYNAWLETPPDDWLKEHDAQLGIVHSKDGMSFPSTDGIYEKTSKARGSIGESGDHSSDWYNNKGSSLRKRRVNGFNNKYLRSNSSSPSLDIVFEGSGSIRLEAENSTKQTGSISYDKTQKNSDTNDSDSEDSDFIQFESRCNVDQAQLTEPFSSTSGSSSSSSSSSSDGGGDGGSSSSSSNGSGEDKKTKQQLQKQQPVTTPVAEARKRALCYQKELRQLQNGDNNINSGLHFEKVYLYIQMQLCRKDTLKDWLRTNCDNRDKTTIFDLFYQIVDAVEYVHSQDLIHRDLKPSNIFFSLDGTLKIGDFGLCRAKTNAGVGSSLDLQEYVAESEVERGFDAVHTEQVGTQLYMSPEQLNGLSYNQKVDIFAMGLILLELLIPFKTQMQRVNVLFKARNNLYSDEFKRDHPNEYELVKSLLSRSPQKRPAATEIKQHDLLANAQLSQPVIERIYHRRRTISSNSSNE